MNNGKKFDICLMNPPYARPNHFGDGLYLDFINKCLEISNKLVSVNPLGLLITQNKGGALKNKTEKFVKIFDEVKGSIEIIENEFDAGIKSKICILDIDMQNKAENIIIQCKNKTYSFKCHKDIRLIESQYLEDFAYKLIKYMTSEDVSSYVDLKFPRLFTHEKDIEIIKDNIYNHIHAHKKIEPCKINNNIVEKEIDKDKLYLYFYKVNATYSSILYKTSNTEAVKYDDKMFNKGGFLYMTFNINEIDKSKKICNYLKTDFCNLILSISGKYIHRYTRYMFMPYIDKDITDKELFKMIGMKYDKEEIDKIL